MNDNKFLILIMMITVMVFFMFVIKLYINLKEELTQELKKQREEDREKRNIDKINVRNQLIKHCSNYSIPYKKSRDSILWLTMSQDIREPYRSYIMNNHINYTLHQGYYFCDYKFRNDSVYPHYTKISAIQDLLQFFDYVSWIDSDMIVVKPDFSIQKLIDKHPTTDLIISNDVKKEILGSIL